jgi:hypothetical protein
MRIRWMAFLLAASGCGGGGAALEAAFAPGTGVDGVSVAESGAVAAADSAGFHLSGLTPGPARVRLLAGGDTVGVLEFAALPSGARVRLDGLRIDPATGLAFPHAVELRGAETLVVNGVRLAPEGRVPRRPEVQGAVLAWSPGTGALLLRPDDAALPDLRVLVVPGTAIVGSDGGDADASGLAPGAAVQLEGTREGAYVLANRLVLRTRLTEDSPAVPEAEPPAPSGDPGSTAPAAAAPAAPPAAAPRPAAPPAAERDRGKGRGNAKGKGKGKGRD